MNNRGLAASMLLMSLLVFGKAAAQDPGEKTSARQFLENMKKKDFQGEILELDFGQTDLRTIFDRFERISGLEFEVPPEFNYRRFYTFRSIEWDRALDLILHGCNLELYLEGEILRVREMSPAGDGVSLIFLGGAAFGLAVLLSALFMTSALKKRARCRQQERRLSLKDTRIDEIRKSLVYLFEVENIHRDESLTLHSLAERLSIPPHQLSWIINVKLGKSFSNLVNHYRIEEVKRGLKQPGYKRETILGIAYDAGFNTKSAFNKAFKIHTGLTPREFRAKASHKT